MIFKKTMRILIQTSKTQIMIIKIYKLFLKRVKELMKNALKNMLTNALN